MQDLSLHTLVIMTTKNISLSRKRLTDAEQNVLEKGLKFTSTTEKEMIQDLKEDLFEFTRKRRLAEYFHVQKILIFL